MGTRKNVSAGQDARVPVFDSYARLSKNPNTGEFEKIETQWADNRKVIERLGGTLGQELDDGLSAWRKDARRPGWTKLLERVASGASDGIVVWHTDRLFRQPRDLEKLIDLADKGFVVVSAHGSRDLADPDDRFILRIEVAHAARSSDDTSRRIKRRFRTFRENGMGHIGGPRRFGWPGRDLTWTPGEGETDDDRPMVPDTLVAWERRALAEATDAALSGISEAVIAREWNDQGLFTAEGRRWVRLTVKSVLSRPTNAGLVESDGKLVATMPGVPIVDPRKFDLLRSKYAARRKGRVAGEVGPGYVGTGIIRCGEHLTLHVDLPALLNHDGPGRGKFRPMIQWARNALIENPNGVAEIDTRVVRNLALFTGCKHHELAEYLAQFTPPPGDIDTEENPDKHE